MDRFTQEQDIVAAIISKIREEQDRAGTCYTLMYVNPGKYSRRYRESVPFGFEEEVKNLNKERQLHLKLVKKLWSLVDQDGFGKPYYLIK